MKYEIKLSAFEGPLDLLLHLISRAKIDIKDIFVSQITEQYLEYIEDMDSLDMDMASDFLQMAATLIYIKSLSLIPRSKDEDIDEEGLTPEERLIAKLNEYKRYKSVSEELKKCECEAALSYYKLPEEVISQDTDTIYVNADVDMLCSMFLNVMKKVKEQSVPQPEVKIFRDSFNVKQQMKVIIARLSIVSRLMFEDVLSRNPGREEVAVTFLSLLELLHKNKIRVRQEDAFSRICITRA